MMFQQDCVRVYQALHRLPSFIEILAGYEGNHQGLIRDCFSTPLKVIYILSIFVFVFCFVFLYLTPIMVWRVGLSTLFMFPFLYLGFNYTVSFQKLILYTIHHQHHRVWVSQHSGAISSFIHGTMIVFRIVKSVI